MANAVFTTSESSAYDDQPELRYHFPRTYLAQARAAVGDWILYYEPRRTMGPSSATGRQAYFAAARVAAITADPAREDHYYANMEQFIELDRAIGFRDSGLYRESGLRKADGSTNKGAFGRAVRLIPSQEFQAIVRAGLSIEPDAWEAASAISEPLVEYEVHSVIERLVSRKYRDVAFRRHVRAAYSNRCAVTGFRLINGGGRPEVQAAHIRSVEHDGPDTVRNGMALTGTMHWLFDRGLMSVDNDFRILLSPQGTPDDLERLIPESRQLILPDAPELRPHPVFLAWHRNNCFKG